jgi:ATP-dependent HslUV protease, peptidase subunit HslV
MNQFQGTTIIGMVKDNQAAIGGDGQVTFGNTIIKATANKLRIMGDGKVLVGFAGSVGDAFALFDRFEKYIKEYPDQLIRASVALAKEWRSDKVLRRLEAMIIALDRTDALIISGSGDVVSPDDGIAAIGSGAPYALAAARALKSYSNLSSQQIVETSLKIASEICIYTNADIKVEVLN